MSGPNLVIAPEARSDVIDIGAYIADDSLEAALRVMDDLERALTFLAENPDAGHFRPELDSDAYRFWHVYHYVIVYR
jgi:toxin ParE1/3/4